MKPGNFIVIVKTLQSRPTNWPSLKGLSLIAHFNFQRAAGVATQKLLSLRHPFRNFRFPGQIQRTKNLSADPVLATRHLSHYFKSGASFAPHRSGCQRFNFVFQPLDLPALQQAFRRTGRENSGVPDSRKHFLILFSVWSAVWSANGSPSTACGCERRGGIVLVAMPVGRLCAANAERTQSGRLPGCTLYFQCRFSV